MPGVCPGGGGMLKFRVDRRITRGCFFGATLVFKFCATPKDLGHLCLLSFDFPVLNSLHFEYVFLFCVFNDAVLMPHRAFQLGLVWLVHVRDSFNRPFLLRLVLVMLGQELIIACFVQ